MTYFLDTDICAGFLNDSFPSIKAHFERTADEQIRIPSVVAAELLYGAERSVRREDNINIVITFLSLYDIVPFDKKAIVHYAAIRADLERRGRPLGGNALLIASTVLANEGILITHNTGEFSRVSGLLTDDWAIK